MFKRTASSLKGNTTVRKIYNKVGNYTVKVVVFTELGTSDQEAWAAPLLIQVVFKPIASRLDKDALLVYRPPLHANKSVICLLYTLINSSVSLIVRGTAFFVVLCISTAWHEPSPLHFLSSENVFFNKSRMIYDTAFKRKKDKRYNR